MGACVNARIWTCGCCHAAAVFRWMANDYWPHSLHSNVCIKYKRDKDEEIDRKRKIKRER